MSRVPVPAPQANTFVAVGGMSAATEFTALTTTTTTSSVSVTFFYYNKVSSRLPDPVRRIQVPAATVPQWRRVAKLARIALNEEEILELCVQLDSIMSFVGQLREVDIAGVEPMTSVTPMAMKTREDKVTDGGIADQIVANAPAHEHNFFLVPKVVE